MRTSSLSRDFAYTLGALLLLLLWEWGGQDMAMAAWFGSPAGFAMHNTVWFDAIFHRWPHDAAWLVLFVFAAQMRWPMAAFQKIPRASIGWGVGATLLAILLIQAMKRASPSSCPWDLREFGGAAQHLPHWRALLWRLSDGGGGHCFPAGSASSGFAFVAAYPFLRQHAPRMAGRWLLGFAAAGLVLGLAQQVRGAHFMSHTLWTAWLCWTAGLLLFWLRAAWAADSPHLRHCERSEAIH
jgi:membrane-associated PAP2 superfamily phosphatase